MKSSLVASSLAVAALCVAGTARAEEAAAAVEPIEPEDTAAVHVWAGVDFKSAYTATGATCNDGWVAQPCVDIYGLKFGEFVLPMTFEFWGNIDLERYEPDEFSTAGHFQEIDLAAYLNLGDYLKYIAEDLDGTTLDVGYVEYDYPGHDADPDHLIHTILKYGFEFDGVGTFTPKFQAKYRIAGPSEGKCEYNFEIAYGATVAEDVVGDWDLGFKLSADAWYVTTGGMDRDEEGYRPEGGWACSYLTAKVSLGYVYVGVQRIHRWEDDVLADGAWGYDKKWVAMTGIEYEF